MNTYVYRGRASQLIAVVRPHACPRHARIKTSLSRGQEEAGRTRRTSDLLIYTYVTVASTAQSLAGAVNKQPRKLFSL